VTNLPGRFSQAGGIGVEKSYGGCGPFVSEVPGLVNEFLGEIEGGEITKTFVPETESHTAGTATGFKQGCVLVGKETFYQDLLGFPQAEKMRGAGVVNNRNRVIEVGADGFGGDLLNRRQLKEIRV